MNGYFCNKIHALRSRHYSKRFLRRIKSEVVRDYTNTKIVPTGKSQPCNGKRCQKCQFIIETSELELNSVKFKIRQTLDCNSSGVIYVIQCSKCNMSYVGETGNMARTRLTNHINDIVHNKNTPVARHFNSSRHNISEHLRFCVIQQISSQKYRKYRESILIKAFNTETPFGINLRCDSKNRFDVITPLVIPFTQENALFATQVKQLNEKHKATDKRIITAFTRHKSLANILTN